MRWLAAFLAAATLLQDAKPRRIEVTADARMLLVTTVISLATEGKFYGKPVDEAYAEAVRTRFADHREHPAVKTAAGLVRRGFSYDAPVGWILHFSDPPELKQRHEPPDEIVKRAPTPAALDDFAAELRDFAKSADFAGFLESQKEAHAAFIKRVKDVLDAEGGVKRLEAFFGESRDSYTLIVAPLVGPHNYGPHVGRHVFQIFNPATHKDEAALKRGVADMVYHEFGHSFTNPLVDAAQGRLEKASALFEPVREAMKRQAYGNWMTCMREHVVRAAAARLVRGELGDLEGARQVAEDYAKGFRYLPPLYRALEEYEKNRGKFQRLADFAPRLFEEIDKIAREGAEAYWARQPFAGRLNDVWTFPDHADKIVFVTPTEGNVAVYARSVAERFKVKPQIVTDHEALRLDAKKHIFVVYGTPSSNLFFKKHADKLPVRVEKNAIVVDGEKFRGDRLRLIAAVPNPVNPRLPMVLYTATDDEIVPGINGIFHGPTGFVVGDDERKVIRQGFLLLR